MREEIANRVEYLTRLFQEERFSFSAGMIEDLKVPDIAEVIAGLDREYRLEFFSALDLDIKSETIPMLDQGVLRELLENLEPEEIASYVNRMASDDAADMINLLEPGRVHLVLERVSRKDYRDLIALLRFDEESAGGIMAREFLVVEKDVTISEAMKKVRDRKRQIEHLHNIYIVDSEGILLGSIPVISLITEDPETPVSEVMNADIERVTADVDQEKVAFIFRKYDLYSLAVVDGRGKLVGRITVDDVMDIIEEEANEDISHLVGTGEEEFWQKSPVKLSRSRMPWLVTGLAGGIAVAIIMNSFREALESIISLAFFVPVIMAMGGNVGIQSSAIVVRELATEDFGFVETGRKILRELKVSLINGSILGLLLFIVVFLWFRDISLGILVASCLMFIVVWATMIGTAIPLLFHRINVDPALATGPFITTFNDIMGVLVYLAMATVMLRFVISH
ncbi:MAG: magnesium transporter [Candidatus Latescibacteria bacterium]|nr:magnesium transporter [bacterium]MBD3425097.1 magnesium transporter [Candidatus Latescibacterota bacterium]